MKLISDCEKDGNNVIKQQFSEEIKTKNKEIIKVAKHNVITTQSGKEINIYELSGEPFTMLVHAITDNVMSSHNSLVAKLIENPLLWNEFMSGNKHISTSLISDKYMVTYGKPNNDRTVMFGFNKIPAQSIKMTDIADIGIDRDADLDEDIYDMRRKRYMSQINAVATVDDLMTRTIQSNSGKTQGNRDWNEIVLSRINENTGEILKPDYIVCMDIISNSSKKAAEAFNIPIYFIQRKKYKELSYIHKNDHDLNESDDLITGHTKK